MANRYTTPIQFAFEKNVTFVYATVTFGAGGQPILDTNNSKGVCAVTYNTPTFSGNTVGSSATMSSVSSFALLYPGMVLTNVGGNALPASVTIGSMTQSATNQTITMSTGTGVPSNNAGTFTASGGQLIFQFGQQAGVRLDTYNRLLSFSEEWIQTSGSATSSVAQVGLIPANKASFIIKDNTGVRTIPQVSTSASTDAALYVQYGSGNATAFLSGNANPGDTLRVTFAFRNSTAQ